MTKPLSSHILHAMDIGNLAEACDSLSTGDERDVMMKTKNVIATLSLFGLLAALNPPASAMGDHLDVQAAARNAVTRSEHETVAKYYDAAATQMKAKVQEQKELLEHYEDKSYLYGRRAQDLQAHTDALIRHYEKTVKANIKEAALHRQIASRLEESNYAASNAQRVTAVTESHHGVTGIKNAE